MKTQLLPNDKKRKREDTSAIPDYVEDVSDLKRLKLSAGLSDDQETHHARETVNENSWSHPDSPDPILCDPVSPPAVPFDSEIEFKGYLRFNEFLGRIHQESRIHHDRTVRHEYEDPPANGHSDAAPHF